jgi:serine/threonine-protein kinase
MGLDRIGKYRILGKIGEGGMGEVYRAHDPLLNRSVAVKTISRGAGDAEFRQRFQREAQAVARLNHPNVVTVYDFGEEDGVTYMAMELLEGRDLKELIASGRLASLAEKLAVMEQVCDGVGFAHAKGVVHRDLKPGNIHVQPSGQVKVLDFGLARLAASDLTRTGTVMGTPHYMSPEQVRGAHVDARSDVFSLGALLYEVLSGRRPFGDAPSHEILLRIQSHEPAPLEQVAPDVPTPLVRLVRRAMEKDPAKRFPQGASMAEALRRARAAIGPGALGLAEDASTWDRAEATVVLGGPGETVVEGSAALAPGRSLAETEYMVTRRSATTVLAPPRTAGPATEPARPRRLPLLLLGAAVLGAAGVAAWVATRPKAPPPAVAAAAQVDILTEALVTGQVELAREDLESRSYESAVERAGKALALSPQSAEAQEVLAVARTRLGERDAAVAEARRALGSGDTEGATRALGRVLAVDPSHPVVAELSRAVDAKVRALAEAARRAVAPFRQAAERARAAQAEPYAGPRRLADEADRLFSRGEFAVAAQRYTESRMAFERAQRQVLAAPSPPATPATSFAPAVARVATTAAAPSPTAAPAAVPPPRREATPLPTAVPAPIAAALPTPAFAAASVPSPAARVTPEAAVRRVIADYGRAIESQDVELFRSLKPDLSPDDEKRLREAFKNIKSQQVGLTIDAVEVDGARASVRVSRQDVVNGRPMKSARQTFRLVRVGETWRIQSIGQ